MRGNPTIIQWEAPSHPAVGAGPLAGEAGGLEELPADIPLFVGEITPLPEKNPLPVYSPPIPLWQLFGMLGLFMMIASISVMDPRPAALARLRETFRAMSAQAKDGSFDNKKIRKTEKEKRTWK